MADERHNRTRPITARSRPVGVLRALWKLTERTAAAERSRHNHRVYCAGDVPPPDDEWSQRIFGLGDGRSVEEIIATLYADELRSGAWVVDIGIWRDILARSVVRHIEELVRAGHVIVRKDDQRRSPVH